MVLPLPVAALQLRLTWPEVPVAVAVGVPGAPGGAYGVAEFEAAEDALLSTPAWATTVKV